MKKNAMRFTLFLCGVLFSLYGFAAAVIETATGTVKVGATASVAATVSQGQRLQAGSMVVTGPKSQAILRFDDGQYVVLHENTEFKVNQYSFVKEDPSKDRFGFELLKGAMRAVTALISSRNPKSYQVRTPQATIGIRGTDFMLAIVNPLYFSVLGGSIEVTNAAGPATFPAGSTGLVANANALAATLPASSMPAGVTTAFAELGAVPIAAPGAVGATGAAAGGISPAAIGIGAAVAAGAAAAAGGGGDNPVAPSSTTGTR